MVLHLDLFGEELLLELGVLVVALLELGLLAHVGVLPIVPVQYLPPLLVPAALSLSSGSTERPLRLLLLQWLQSGPARGVEEEARSGICVLPSLLALLIELADSVETAVLRVAPAHLF